MRLCLCIGGFPSCLCLVFNGNVVYCVAEVECCCPTPFPHLEIEFATGGSWILNGLLLSCWLRVSVHLLCYGQLVFMPWIGFFVLAFAIMKLLPLVPARKLLIVGSSWHGTLVAKVQFSKYLSSSPCVLVSGKFGWSANMERLMKAQPLRDTTSLEFMRGGFWRLTRNTLSSKTLMLRVRTKNTPDSDDAKIVVELLHNTTLISSGFTVNIKLFICVCFELGKTDF